MAQIQSFLSFIAGPLFLVGFVPYILAIRRGESKPAKASWIIWLVVDTIVLAGMVAAGTLNAQIVGAVCGAGAVSVLALRYGTRGWTTLDLLCIVGAAIGIGLWMYFQNPTLGIVTCSFVIFLGAFPTFASAWKDPSREDKVAWTIFWLSCVCAVVGIPSWTWADATQPLTFFIIESIVMALIFLPRRSVSA